MSQFKSALIYGTLRSDIQTENKMDRTERCQICRFSERKSRLLPTLFVQKQQPIKEIKKLFLAPETLVSSNWKESEFS